MKIKKFKTCLFFRVSYFSPMVKPENIKWYNFPTGERDILENCFAKYSVYEHGVKDLNFVYITKDTLKTRWYLREIRNSNKHPIFLFSGDNTIGYLAWKVPTDIFVCCDEADWLAEFEALYYNFITKYSVSFIPKIPFKFQQRIDFIAPSDILFIKADGPISWVYTESRTSPIACAKNLGAVVKMLANFNFIERFGKSIIINLNKITSIEGKKITFSGKHIIEFPKYGNSFTLLKNKLIWNIKSEKLKS